jgi:hypothetical protein
MYSVYVLNLFMFHRGQLAFSSSDSSDGTSNVSQNEDDDWMCEATAIGSYAMLNYRTSSTKKARKVPDEAGYQ